MLKETISRINQALANFNDEQVETAEIGINTFRYYDLERMVWIRLKKVDHDLMADLMFKSGEEAEVFIQKDENGTPVLSIDVESEGLSQCVSDTSKGLKNKSVITILNMFAEEAGF